MGNPFGKESAKEAASEFFSGCTNFVKSTAIFVTKASAIVGGYAISGGIAVSGALLGTGNSIGALMGTAAFATLAPPITTVLFGGSLIILGGIGIYYSGKATLAFVNGG